MALKDNTLLSSCLCPPLSNLKLIIARIFRKKICKSMCHWEEPEKSSFCSHRRITCDLLLTIGNPVGCTCITHVDPALEMQHHSSESTEQTKDQKRRYQIR